MLSDTRSNEVNQEQETGTTNQQQAGTRISINILLSRKNDGTYSINQLNKAN